MGAAEREVRVSQAGEGSSDGPGFHNQWFFGAQMEVTMCERKQRSSYDVGNVNVRGAGQLHLEQRVRANNPMQRFCAAANVRL